jgi:hypothetical protein
MRVKEDMHERFTGEISNYIIKIATRKVRLWRFADDEGEGKGIRPSGCLKLAGRRHEMYVRDRREYGWWTVGENGWGEGSSMITEWKGCKY